MDRCSGNGLRGSSIPFETHDRSLALDHRPSCQAYYHESARLSGKPRLRRSLGASVLDTALL